jgi:hypothetical protein
MQDLLGGITPEQLRQLIGSGEPAELRNQLRVLRSDVPYARGTTVPLLAPRFAASNKSSLAKPIAATASPMDYLRAFVASSEYVDLPADALAAGLLATTDQTVLISALGVLAAVRLDDELVQQLHDEYARGLKPATRVPFVNAAAGKALLARQPLLAAFRGAVMYSTSNTESPTAPAEQKALMLTHAYGSMLGGRVASIDHVIDTTDAFSVLAVELLQNQHFNDSEDPISLIDRQRRLWFELGSKAEEHSGGRSASVLFSQATGIELDDVLALGFCLYAHVMNWEPRKGIAYPVDMGATIDESTRDRFIALFVATIEELQAVLADATGDWDFLAFEQKPVIRLESGLVVLDAGLLLTRITTGLYWFVHDFLRDKEGDKARNAWTIAWGSILESAAEDSLKTFAPIALDGRTFFTEEDLAVAYPGQGIRRCDAVIDYGSALLAAEIVSGQLTVPTRVFGDADRLKDDIEKIVMKKARQLDQTITCLQEEARLPGVVANGPVFPLIVACAGFPMSPIMSKYIEKTCKEEGILQQGPPLMIIDFGELEMLEGLHERGTSALELLRGWKTSELAEMPLRNYLILRFEDRLLFRPTRMEASTDRTFATVIDRFRLGDGRSGEDAVREMRARRAERLSPKTPLGD